MNSDDKPHFGQAVAMLALFIAFQTIFAVPVVAILSAIRGTMTVDMTLVGIANAAAMIPTVWLGSIICKKPWRDLIRFGPIPWRLIGAVLLTGLGGFVLCSEVENVTRMVLPMPRAVAHVFRKMFAPDANPVGALLALVIVAPLTEELICRGWVLRSLLPRMAAWKAIALSGVIFGLMHMNPWQFFYASVLGLILGWIYYRTRSLWLVVFLHAFNNGTSWGLSYFQPEIPGLTTGLFESAAQFQPWWLDLTALMVFLAGVFLFKLQTPMPPQLPPSVIETPPVLPGTDYTGRISTPADGHGTGVGNQLGG